MAQAEVLGLVRQREHLNFWQGQNRRVNVAADVPNDQCARRCLNITTLHPPLASKLTGAPKPALIYCLQVDSIAPLPPRFAARLEALVVQTRAIVVQIIPFCLPGGAPRAAQVLQHLIQFGNDFHCLACQ